MRPALAGLCLAALTGLQAAAMTEAAAPPVLMHWPDLLGRPRPAPDATLSYGDLPQQEGDLWLPARPRAPLVVMIHGGCWTKSIADRTIMNYAADDLRRRGIAVWNIEYRGVDEPGGGYPGTFQDVGRGIDAAREIARTRGLDLSRPVLVGHSAGGHLALWAAARPKLPAASPLQVEDPLPIVGVVDLAGIPDLARDLETACGAAPIAAMVGGPAAGRSDVYADTSPAALLPLRVPQVVLHGAGDVTVRPEIGAAYAARAQALGDKVKVVSPPGGHVEEIAPGSEAWEAAAREIQELLRAP